MIKPISLVLTATIDVSGVHDTSVVDARTRLRQYIAAFRGWIHEPLCRRIIICENSGYDSREWIDEISRLDTSHRVTLLQFRGQTFDRKLGKGYGEIGALEHVSRNVDTLDGELLVKVNGRYNISNFGRFASIVNKWSGVSLIGNFRHDLSWMDSRFFAFSKEFLDEYLIPRKEMIDDSKGIYFEHALARAAHACMADGRVWRMVPVCPVLIGQSGSTGFQYSRYGVRRLMKMLYLAALRWLTKI